ncbi:hypothetical protein FE783_21890 [Paenibacillus mesophilus]|uniref:alpha/beta hydrolase family protein n=1 Tax=Paenibacillus mesophilus TaxID=2582849 RepID=UPI00110E012F|nr:alpha/beta hydrolase family protein [Paenibacillus mesophilus]TMV47642.1 hypothetical protein FE783_21890 [Paenibacillus mesophilus]
MHFNTEAYLTNMAQSNRRRFDYRKALADGSLPDWQREFRLSLRELLGMRHIDASTVPLHPEKVETAEYDTYTLEKWYIATEQGITIPFYLLLPRGKQGPFPLVLAPHGHGRRGKEVYVGRFEDEKERSGALEGDRDIALQAVEAGYAVIAPDVRGFWEMAQEEDMTSGKANSCESLQRSALMYGRTLIGERVHDMGRLIDYAATRSEIDASRIAITGNSGGGTVSLFAAAIDERIRAAIPGSYFCTFERSIVPLRHCACNLVPGILNLGEMYDVAGLIAPRPILIVHGQNDFIYPIEGTREAFSHLQLIYRSMNAADRCELYVGQGGHRYYKERVWDFVKEHL